MKGHRPLTHHISSITITTKNAQAIKMNKLTMQIIKPHRTSISCKYIHMSVTDSSLEG